MADPRWEQLDYNAILSGYSDTTKHNQLSIIMRSARFMPTSVTQAYTGAINHSTRLNTKPTKDTDNTARFNIFPDDQLSAWVVQSVDSLVYIYNDGDLRITHYGIPLSYTILGEEPNIVVNMDKIIRGIDRTDTLENLIDHLTSVRVMVVLRDVPGHNEYQSFLLDGVFEIDGLDQVAILQESSKSSEENLDVVRFASRKKFNTLFFGSLATPSDSQVSYWIAGRRNVGMAPGRKLVRRVVQ